MVAWGRAQPAGRRSSCRCAAEGDDGSVSRVLVAYATKSGSTQEVADTVGAVLRRYGLEVDVCAPGRGTDVGLYDAVVVGSPVLYGGPSRTIRRFLSKHRSALRRIPVACFLTCMELTDVPELNHLTHPTYVDPSLALLPAVQGKLTLFERTHLLSGFIDRLLAGSPEITPVSVAVFAGKVDYATLDPFSRFVMRMIWRIYRRAPEGDRRNWDAIRAWAEDLAPRLLQAP